MQEFLQTAAVLALAGFHIFGSRTFVPSLAVVVSAATLQFFSLLQAALLSRAARGKVLVEDSDASIKLRVREMASAAFRSPVFRLAAAAVGVLVLARCLRRCGLADYPRAFCAVAFVLGGAAQRVISSRRAACPSCNSSCGGEAGECPYSAEFWANVSTSIQQSETPEDCWADRFNWDEMVPAK